MKATVIKAPAGLGKTHAFAERVALSRTTPIEIYVPTHLLAEEWRAQILRFNPGKVVQVMQGRSAEGTQPLVRLCLKHTAAEQLSKMAIPVYPNLCKRAGPPGFPPDKCPFHDNCDYLNQFRRADAYIYTHAHLPLGRGPLESWTPAEVIIDETFFQSLIQPSRFPIALLTHPAVPVAAQNLCRDISVALAAGKPLQARFATARGVGGDFDAAYDSLKTKANVAPSMTKRQLSLALSRHVNFEPIRTLLATLATELNVRSISQAVLYDAMRAQVVVHYRRPITRFDRSNGTQPKVFILDASASVPIIEPFVEIEKFETMAVARNAYVLQCRSTRCSTTSLVPSKNTDPVSKAAATDRIADIDRLLTRLSAGRAKVLVIGPVAVVGNAKTGTLPLVTVPVHCELAHFNALRGVDRWKDFDHVVIVGRNEPPIEAIEDIARGLFYDDPRPLTLTGAWEYEVRGYRIKGEKCGVDTPVHADRRVQAVVEQLREQESLQALDRLRLVHSRTTKTVILLSNLPLDLDVDELRTWDELIHGTRLERAWAAATGVMPINPTWLAANYPVLWSTAEAAKQDVRGAHKRGDFPKITTFRKTTLFGFKYKPRGQRQWSRCLASKSNLKQVGRALCRLLGEPVDIVRGLRLD